MKVNAQIDDAVEVIKQHARVSNVRTRLHPAGSGIIVSADFDTNLASTWKANGESPTGVKKLEEVEIFFPVDYPLAAPTPTLRPDFNRALPHINPHHADGRVPPCVVLGSTLELIHSDGVARFVDQIAHWLEKAAENSLNDQSQGWEPMRRDRGNDTLEINTEAVARQAPRIGGLQLYDVECIWERKGPVSHAFAATPSTVTVFHGKELRLICEQTRLNEAVAIGKTLLAVCWPVIGFDGRSAVYDQYQPDIVHTMEDLNCRAAQYGCDQALARFEKMFNTAARDLPLRGGRPIFIALAVRRPFPLIGFATDFEVLAYRINAPIPSGLNTQDKIPVNPVALLEPVSSSLLRRTSGLQDARHEIQTVFIGCGSVGSKVALHLARAGFPPKMLVDRGTLAAHNAARHVLHPFDSLSIDSKATELAKVLSSYTGKMPMVFNSDVQKMSLQGNAASAVLNDEQSIVVNTTGSHAVRDFLAEFDVKARVLEACAMNLGDLGVVTLEGSGKNPSTSDVMAFAYERIRVLGVLQVPDVLNENLLRIGVGCNSVTLPMSDARISLISAGVGHAILGMYQNGLPPSGKLFLAQVDDNGMSICWVHHELAQTQLANLTATPGWTVRVLASAHEKISANVALHPTVETGGLIVGRVSALNREIIITDVLDAPPDSTRSANKFVLGVVNRAAQITEYDASGNGVLWCLGTWHSHLGAFGPSSLDIATANLLEGELRGAGVLLIHRPDGYSAIVRNGK